MTIFDLYTDARTHGYDGPSRTVRLARVATSGGGGAISKSEDGTRCVVAGKESLRILRLSEPPASHEPDHKFAVGKGGHRIDASRNFWEGSGLKIDSASTDVAWCHGTFNSKILTSARNGGIIMWDLNKTGPTKYERKTKDHIRSIQKMSYSPILPHYCVTGSADGDIRVWDLRAMDKSIQRIRHPDSVRSVVLSRIPWKPLQVIVGLDNGSIFRWDLYMGQRGRLDRRAAAHRGPVLALDWCTGVKNQVTDDHVGSVGSGGGWLASGGLDRCVKIWDLSVPDSAIPHKPTYTLHPAFPVRRVQWRPEYGCELVVVSNVGSSVGSNQDLTAEGTRERDQVGRRQGEENDNDLKRVTPGDALEIWDVRRAWVAKWAVSGSATEGGTTDVAFADAQAIWAQHSSGTFSQFDLRECVKPLDAIPRSALTWDPSGAFVFASDDPKPWEIPYDDINPRDGRPNDPHKRLGDSLYVPSTQFLGKYASDNLEDDSIAFKQLAKEYIFEGDNRSDICSRNADIAFRAGKPHAAQVWLLLASLLSGLPSLLAQSPPKSLKSPRLSLAPPTSYTFPPRYSRSLSSEKARHINTPSSSRRVTPTSSASASPHRPAVSLPSIAQIARGQSVFSRRDSRDVSSVRHPSSSTYRSASVSTTSTTRATTASPSDNSSRLSLRHVGDGALDDSDSSGGESRREGDEDEPSNSHMPLQRMAPPHPSPLSRVGWNDSDDYDEEGEHEDEDEDDEDDDQARSPCSTDAEDGTDRERNGRLRRHSRKPRKTKMRLKARSRGSIVASLPIPGLLRQESQMSLRTVTAEGSRNPSLDQLNEPQLRRGSVDVLRDARRGSADHSMSGGGGPRGAGENEDFDDKYGARNEAKNRFSEKRRSNILTNRQKFDALAWKTLRDALEVFAEEGDIQMCAFMALVAPEELRVDSKRALRFLESYIETLHRLKLFTSASYLRKHVPMQKIRISTTLETVIYTSCGRCWKPIVVPGGPRQQAWRDPPKGGYSFCIRCKAQTVTCSLCHLPVRTLLFHCAVCNHGGHQACYRQFYSQRPPVEMPLAVPAQPTIDIRTESRHMIRRESSASSIVESDDGQVLESVADPPPAKPASRLLAHECAAGCGHFCWAISGYFDEP